MDEAEAGAAVVLCYKCHNKGHTYKRYTATSLQRTSYSQCGFISNFKTIPTPIRLWMRTWTWA
jgi:hypothetical protein